MRNFNQGDFDFPQGDVTITIKSGDIELFGRVSSAAMALASKVWEKFMFPPWQVLSSTPNVPNPSNDISSDSDPTAQAKVEVKRTEKDCLALNKANVDFSEDDAEALFILLQVAHLQFHKLPLVLGAKLLLQIALLCDQYMCAHLVRPWMQNWIIGAGLIDHEFTATIAPEQCFFIYWLFGSLQDSSRMLRKMASITKIQDGKCLTAQGHPLIEPLPSGIADLILEDRKKLIGLLLEVPYDLVTVLASRSSGFPCSDDKCRATMYGSLLLQLEELKLWPRQPADMITCTAAELGANLSEIFVLSLVDHHHHHYGAASLLKFETSIRAILDTEENPLPHVFDKKRKATTAAGYHRSR